MSFLKGKEKGSSTHPNLCMIFGCSAAAQNFFIFSDGRTIKKLGIPNVTLWDPIEVKQKCFLKGSYLGHCLGDPNSLVQEGCHNQLQTIQSRTNIPTRGHDWFCIVHDHCIPWDSLLKCNVYHSNLKNKTLKVEHLMRLSKVWIF